MDTLTRTRTVVQARVDVLQGARDLLEAFFLGRQRNVDPAPAHDPREEIARALLGYLAEHIEELASVRGSVVAAAEHLTALWDDATSPPDLETSIRDALRILFRQQLLSDGLEPREAGRRAREKANNWVRTLPAAEPQLFADFVVECCDVDALKDWWITNRWRSSKTAALTGPSTVTRAELSAAYENWWGRKGRPNASAMPRDALYQAVDELPGVSGRTFGRAHARGWTGIRIRKKG